jgi:phosphatidylglycerol---prolipoprotein diacylglyceryl transferase
MDNILHLYQNLPSSLNPVAFSVGFLQVDWYSLGYLAAFLTVYFLLKHRAKEYPISNIRSQALNNDFLFNFLFHIFIALLLGARLGYVLFYNLPFYLENPLAIVSPFDSSSGEFVGIYGMSYHGGLVGALLGAYLFTRKKKIDFWRWADFVVPAVPAGYFFGRVGNFLNGELYGRITNSFLGMYFPSSVIETQNLASDETQSIASLPLRHPSQLYEAFFEGVVLFWILWKLRNKDLGKGGLLGVYLFGYAVFRIGIEFFREPDTGVGLLFGIFSRGQVLSFVMLVLGATLFLLGQKRKKMV